VWDRTVGKRSRSLQAVHDVAEARAKDHPKAGPDLALREDMVGGSPGFIVAGTVNGDARGRLSGSQLSFRRRHFHDSPKRPLKI